jgi:hypothetical protein
MRAGNADWDRDREDIGIRMEMPIEGKRLMKSCSEEEMF